MPEDRGAQSFTCSNRYEIATIKLHALKKETLAVSTPVQAAILFHTELSLPSALSNAFITDTLERVIFYFKFIFKIIRRIHVYSF